MATAAGSSAGVGAASGVYAATEPAEFVCIRGGILAVPYTTGSLAVPYATGYWEC